MPQAYTSVKMLNKDVPQLYKSRARDRVLGDTMQTERDCREDRLDLSRGGGGLPGRRKLLKRTRSRLRLWLPQNWGRGVILSDAPAPLGVLTISPTGRIPSC